MQTTARSAVLVVLATLLLDGCYPSPHQVTYLAPHLPEGLHAIYPREANSVPPGFLSLCREMSGLRHGQIAFDVEGVRLCVLASSPCRASERDAAVNAVPIRFEVLVESREADATRPRALLEWNGRSETMIADVIRQYISTPPHLHLGFLSTTHCDPDERYRLTVTGITVQGRSIRVPPVTFEPDTESFSFRALLPPVLP